MYEFICHYPNPNNPLTNSCDKPAAWIMQWAYAGFPSNQLVWREPAACYCEPHAISLQVQHMTDPTMQAAAFRVFRVQHWQQMRSEDAETPRTNRTAISGR